MVNLITATEKKQRAFFVIFWLTKKEGDTYLLLFQPTIHLINNVFLLQRKKHFLQYL